MLFNNSLFSQALITDKFDNKPLVEVLELLTKKYEIKLAYDNKLVQSSFVTASFINEPVEDVLKKILKPNGLEFLKLNDVYIVKVSTATPEPEPVKQIKYKVLGVVKEKGTGETLPYASVVVQGNQTGTASNTDGYFSLSSNRSDSIVLKISYIGFEPIELKVAPQTLGKDVMIFELERNSIHIKDAVIVKNQPEQLVAFGEPGLMQLNSGRSSTLTTISNIDIAAPLQLLPGVDGTTESLSGLMVRHSTSDKNLFIYDGFTIYHIDHFFGAFSSFNSKAIKDIRVIRGGFDAHWGGRSSSVVEITGKTGNENQLIADAGVDLLGADIEIEGPVGKKASFVIAARRSFTDYFKSSLYSNLFESARSDITLNKFSASAFTNEASEPHYFYYDFNTKLSFKPTMKDLISVSAYKGYDQLNYNKSDANPFINEDSDWGNMGAGLRWSRQWGSRFYHNFTLGASKYDLFYDHRDSSVVRSQAGSISRITRKHFLIDNQLDDINANFQGQLMLGAKDQLEFGFAGNNVNISSTEATSNYINTIQIIDTALLYSNISGTYTFWAQNTLSIKALNSLKLGARYTYHNLTGKSYFEPRVQMVIKPVENLSLKFAAGIYYQFVNKVILLDNGYYRNKWVASDGLRFPVVKSTHLIAGFVVKSNNGFSVDFEAYSKSTSGISFVQTVLRKTGNGPNAQVKQEKRTFTMNNNVLGIDLLLKKSWERGQFWVAYTISQSYNQCDQVNGGDEYPALDDQLHELKLVGVYSLKHWNFTASWIYGSGKHWDEILLTSNYLISPDYDKNAALLPPYHRLDLGISYNFKFLKGEIETGVKVFNLYNHINSLAKPYKLSENLLQDIQQGNPIITYNENLGMGVTPTFFLNLKF